MQINLSRKNKAYHFEALNEQGNTLNMDSSPAIGGENQGFRPMETLLAGLGGCSAIDMISILKKQKEPLEDLQISINGKRFEGKEPSLFETIDIEFHVFGQVNEAKIQRALELTFDKYCSVAQILNKTAKINFSYKLN
ncbi:MAG: OsmC family protein [Mucilaginibacter sp.]|uniref:OsmC family protein n=1 Tax=Mucilaginibacter sp. TaxID=1882438 RepID=UPI0034E510EB